MTELVEKLYQTGDLSDGELKKLIETDDKETAELLRRYADETRQKSYGKKVFLRGLIEVSSYCKNNCLYCGIRRGNKEADRYRLSREDILKCCENGYELGFRTFVMQGGEDAFFTDDFLCPLISEIKEKYPDCAVTLSLGERSYESYKRLKEAGADRYLLRHEAASQELYSKLHPEEMSLENRKGCLFQLKELGYQVGAGFMVGSPGQTIDTIMKDLEFISTFRPEMVGIGPFIPAAGTPFENERAGSVELTLRLLAIIRLLHPHVLLPATSALGTMHPTGRERAIAAGANVVMPNLSPRDTRALYSIYNNKLSTDSEAAENAADIRARMKAIGMEVPMDRGDYLR